MKHISKLRPFLPDLHEKRRHSALWRYSLALLCVLVAFGIRLALHSIIGLRAPYILFVPAVLITAWFGGMGPSLLAIATAFLLANYFFISPVQQWAPLELSQFVASATYIFSALVVFGLINRVRHEQKRLRAKADESLLQTELLQEEIGRRTRVEDRLQAIMDSSSAMIFLKDTEGRYLLSNRQFETITHQPGAEIIGKTDREIFAPQQADCFRANDIKVLETGLSLEFEETAIHDDGPHISIVHKFPLHDASGKVYALGGIVTDITQRKRAEEELRKAQQGYANLVSNIDGIVWESDPQTLTFRFVSRKAEQLLLYPRERWLTPNFWPEHLHPDDRDWAVKFCREATHARRNHDFEYRMIAADGRTVWLRDIVNIAVESSGAVKLRGIMVDITEQKRAEQALRESEEKYRSLYTKTPVMVHSIDPDGNLISVSDLWLKALGYTSDEVIGHKSVEFLTPESRKYAEEVVLPEYFKTGFCQDIPYRMVKKNGEVMDVLLSGIAEKNTEGKVIRSLAVIIDVTSRKHAERALRSSETRLRVLAETAVDAIISANSSENITQFNPAAERIFGYAAHEIMGKAFTTLMASKSRDTHRTTFARYLEMERTRLMGKVSELVGMKKDGTEFPLELSLSSWETAEGQFFTCILRDITERKQAEEDLRQSEEMLRITTEGASIGLWSWDVANDFLTWNSIEYQQFALPSDKKMKFQDFLDCIHPDDRAYVNEAMETSINENRELDMEYRVVWPDGAVRWRHCKGRPTYVDNRPVRMSGMSLDITERKSAEQALQEARDALALHAQDLEQRVARRTEQLQQSLKDMESFCYTIAHDLRSPLRAMSGFSQSLAQDYGSQLDAIGLDYCDRINAAAARMGQLISDLLVYGRLTHSQLPRNSVDLETEIEKVIVRSASQIDERHADVKVDKPLPHVWGDAPVLDQVLENLILNAVKFVPPERQPHVHIFAEHHDDTVRLCVEDNGIGIPSEHQERIFRPFERLHTTAYPGTGVGLAIVQRGIQKMGGIVGVESSIGRGSRFWIELPEQCDRLSTDEVTAH